MLPSKRIAPPPAINPSTTLWELATARLTPKEMGIFQYFGGGPETGKGKWNHAVKLLQRKTGKSFTFLKHSQKGRDVRARLTAFNQVPT